MITNRIFRFRASAPRRSVAVLATVSVFLMFAVCPAAGWGNAARPAGNGGEDTVKVDTACADVAVSEPDLLWPLNVQSRLEVLLQSEIFETSTVGLMVYDLTADSVIFKHNERQLMRPASTLKMMVAVAALDRLGKDYEFETALLHTGEVEGGVLRGDLYCRGGFDPAFGSSDLDRFVDSLRALGVDTIIGDLYADVSMKDGDRLGEGWCWDDDNPVLSPLLVSGENDFAGRLLGRLRRAGIVVEGGLKTGNTPRRARKLCAIRRPMTDVLPRMMKQSDNLYSESVFYNLAASAADGEPATAKLGRNVMNRLIERLGFKPSRYYIADGSGLSLYNYVSPELEVAFLRYAYGNDGIYVPLYQVMPVAGEDGTLRSRMRRGYARGNVHAKTGTVTGVSALAGYCKAANGHVLCFSIINMGIRRASTGRHFQDRVCEALCRP